jgi:hypothetical protein
MSQCLGMERTDLRHDDATTEISFALARACKTMLSLAPYERGQFVLRDEELRSVLESCEKHLSARKIEVGTAR